MKKTLIVDVYADRLTTHTAVHLLDLFRRGGCDATTLTEQQPPTTDPELIPISYEVESDDLDRAADLAMSWSLVRSVKGPGGGDPRQITGLVSVGHDEYQLSLATGWTPVWPPEDWLAGDHSPEEIAAKWEEQTRTSADEVDDWDLEWEAIYRLDAPRAEVEKALTKLMDEISSPPGGDDDTFDYWPSGVRLALTVAEKLSGAWPDDVRLVASTVIIEYLAEWAEELFAKVGIERPAGQPATVWARRYDSPDRVTMRDLVNHLYSVARSVGEPVSDADASAASTAAQVIKALVDNAHRGIDLSHMDVEPIRPPF